MTDPVNMQEGKSGAQMIHSPTSRASRPEGWTDPVPATPTLTDHDVEAIITRWLASEPVCQRKSKCPDCWGKRRYPDFRCALHSIYLHLFVPHDRVKLGNDYPHYLSVWRAFIERARGIL